jgi:hypothetical protein
MNHSKIMWIRNLKMSKMKFKKLGIHLTFLISAGMPKSKFLKSVLQNSLKEKELNAGLDAIIKKMLQNS